MEFTGRVKKILPARSGVSQRTGNEWKALPFIFEYFENPTDRFADTVLLETFDTNVIDNLKEGMEVRCGFGHRTREYEGKTYNELRLYKIESVRGAQQAPQAANVPAAGQSPIPPFPEPQNPSNQADDDLPF
jgi:hypothetical protein